MESNTIRIMFAEDGMTSKRNNQSFPNQDEQFLLIVILCIYRF